MAQRRRTHNKSKIRSLDAERARRLRERAKSTPTRASKAKRKAGKFDFTLFLVVLLLMLFGIVMVFSSSYYYALTNSNFNNDMYYFVKRQIMWSGLGICAMIFLMNFPYRIIKNFTFIAYIFAIACLILVLIVGI